MTKGIHILNDKAIAVVVPEHAYDFYIGNGYPAVMYWIGRELKNIPLPCHGYEIIGLADKLDENQWKQVISPVKTFGYPSYGAIPLGVYQWFVYAKESGLSLLTSKGLAKEGILIIIKK